MKQRSIRNLSITALAVMLALATGGAVLASSSGPPIIEPPVIPVYDAGSQTGGGQTAASGCRTSFTNGSGTSLFKYCYSDDGNITMIEHAGGLEHVAIGAAIEGWCVSADGSVRGSTYGDFDNFLLDPPTYPHPTKVRHHTADGDLRVESRFSWSPGNKQIVVKMIVRNLSGAPLPLVFLTRFVDPDVANTTDLDFWTSTPRTVTAHEPGAGFLQMIPKSDDFPVASMIFPDTNLLLDEFCYNAAADATVGAEAGDRMMALLYNLGDFDTGEIKTVQFVYRVGS